MAANHPDASGRIPANDFLQSAIGNHQSAILF